MKKLLAILFTGLMIMGVSVFTAAATECSHIPCEAVEESFEAETCTTDGYYDMVVYCEKCGEELSRETYTIDKRGHKEGEVVAANTVAPTYTKQGSYELITYCSVCSQEMKFEKIIIKKKTLSQVKNVQWEALSDTEVRLKWSKVENADGHRVYKYNAAEKKWEKVKTTSSLAYTVKELEAGKQVKFRVKAYKKADGVTVWGKASQTVTASATPAVVKTVKASSKTENSIKLKWSKAQGAKGYRVYMYNSDTKKWEKVKTVSLTTYTVKGLKADTVYKFRVKAYTKTAGKTLWGKATPTLKTYTTVAKPEKAVFASLTAGKQKFTAKWKEVPAATGYELDYSTGNDFSSKRTIVLNGSQSIKRVVSSLESGETYYVRVRAYRYVAATKLHGAYTVCGAYSDVQRVKVK